MKALAILLLTLFSLAFIAFGYPEEQLLDCELSVKQSPIILGAPEISIQKFCDCSLKLIIDESFDGKNAINICASRNFK